MISFVLVRFDIIGSFQFYGVILAVSVFKKRYENGMVFGGQGVYPLAVFLEILPEGGNLQKSGCVGTHPMLGKILQTCKAGLRMCRKTVQKMKAGSCFFGRISFRNLLRRII